MLVMSPELLTVASLRKYLNEMEALWSAEDTKHLGEFDSQKINIPFPTNGIGPAQIIYNGCSDFIIVPKGESC